MDAFAVTICKGLSMKKITAKEGIICGLWFGVFQGMMPMIGYFMGTRFQNLINKVAPWLAFILLTIIGVNMLREAFSQEEEDTDPGLDVKTMFFMAVATSIDALAVGITFVAVPVKLFNATQLINTITACIIIAAITFITSFIGVKIGNVFGMRYKSGAEAAGGFVLIFIGLKILLEHLGVIEFMSDADVLFGLLIPLAGTIFGAASVFVVKSIKTSVKQVLTGMTGGIMLSCSMWGLLYPTISTSKVYTAFLGFLIGILSQFMLDKLVPHTHVYDGTDEGPHNKLKRTTKVMLTEIIHHVPEGIAVGVMYAGFLTNEISLMTAIAMTIGIAIQNVPEGAFVSSPVNEDGEEKGKSFLMGVISGIVEPLLGIVTIIIVGLFPGIIFFVMSLTAGAMTFLVLEESTGGKHSDEGTLSFAVFFALMMLMIFKLG